MGQNSGTENMWNVSMRERAPDSTNGVAVSGAGATGVFHPPPAAPQKTCNAPEAAFAPAAMTRSKLDDSLPGAFLSGSNRH